MMFEQSILISASPGDLFALTQDYDRRLIWDPFLKSAELLGGAKVAGVGVRAYCVAHSGLGMGLAIVQDLVRLHRGHIEAYSNGPRQGSLFVVTLPRMTAEGDDADGAELVAGHA